MHRAKLYTLANRRYRSVAAMIRIKRDYLRVLFIIMTVIIAVVITAVFIERFGTEQKLKNRE